jgi:hypothetical protein
MLGNKRRERKEERQKPIEGKLERIKPHTQLAALGGRPCHDELKNTKKCHF